jgi:hypothetical protein
MTAMALDRRDSNLPSLKCFVPLVHEMVYYLASPAVPQMSVAAGAEFVMRSSGSLENAQEAAEAKPKVLTPSNRQVPAELATVPDGLQLRFAGTYEPGLYRVTLPAGLDKHFALPADAEGSFPFAAVGDAEEGRLTPLSEGDYESLAKRLDFFRAPTTDTMIQAVTGHVPGEELWKYLAVALLVALLAEVGLARWIATRRRMHAVDTVTFGAEPIDVVTFRERARDLLAMPGEQLQGARKA